MDQKDENLNILEFELAGRSYCVRDEDLDEIFILGNLTHVPLSPPGLIGLTCLRGLTYPCIDVFALQNQVANPWYQTKTYGLMVALEEIQFVLVAWGITGLVEVPVSSVLLEASGIFTGYWMEQSVAKPLLDVRNIPNVMKNQISNAWAKILQASDQKGISHEH